MVVEGIGNGVKHLGLCLLCLGAVVLTACGGVTLPAPAPKAAAQPSLRSLMPLDANADGAPDAPVSASLRRLLVQVPREFQVARLSLWRGQRELKFIPIPHTLRGGDRVIELVLEQPLGAEPVILRAGAYELKMAPVNHEPATALLPLQSSALANDLIAPSAVVIDSPEDAQLLCTQALPSITAEVKLTCGEGEPVALVPFVSARGLALTPASPLLSGRAYALSASGPDSLGRDYACNCSLLVRPAGIVAMVRGDFDRDGKDELVALSSSGTLTLLGDPMGGGEALPLPFNGRGLDLCTGDFDGNGLPDLAVVLRTEDGFVLVKLLADMRTGRLQFTFDSRKLALEAPHCLCCGDIDRDGRDDILIGSAFGSVSMHTSKWPRRTIEALPRALLLKVALADIDGDKDLDLLALAADGQSRVVVNRGSEGLGDKPEWRDVKTLGAARAAIADFEPNARADVLLTGGIDGCRLMLDIAARAASLDLSRDGEGGRMRSGSALARDLNNDNRVDLIVAREDAYGLSADFAVIVNTQGERKGPDGVFSLDGRYNINCIEYWRGHIAFGTDSGLLLMGLAPIQVPLNETTKARFLRAYEPMPRIETPHSAAMADFNGDGKADVATVDAAGKLVIWLSGEAGERFTASGEPIDLGGTGSLQVIDFDRDSFPDILFVPADPSARPRLLRNKGDGRLEEDLQNLLPTPPAGLLGAPALGDFNRDGHFDVFWPSEVGLLHFSDGPGRWRVFAGLPVVRDGSGRVLNFSGELCCADFTGDGLADVVAVMQPGSSAQEQALVLFEGTGNAEQPFLVHVTTAARGHYHKLAPADFNGDRRIDLATGYARPGEPPQLLLLTLDASKQFMVVDGSPLAQGDMLDLAVDDIDRDGDLDLMVSERVDGDVVVTLWVNAGDGRFVRGAGADDSLKKALRGFAATNLSIADFTGDGIPDLLAVDRGGNVVLVRSSIE